MAIGGCLLAGAGVFANPTDQGAAGAIQAIQQAADPSAAIGAYANGLATDRNNPRIYEAYIGKMVELGLPEMAYHQAESLTGLESNNGLAWGVVAYVDARRGQMAEAVSAVVLAGQFAPDNAFVQRTAGELTAWYDLKADKSSFSDSTKDAVAKLRVSLDKRTAFAEAYTTASKAYQSPATTAPPAQSSISPNPAQGQQQVYSPDTAAGYNAPSYPYDPGYYGPPPYPYDYAAYPPPYDYYPSYGPYYWGAGWIAPSAWWWWPVGSFAGCSFFPCSSFVVFDHHHGNFHDGHFHDGHSHSHDGFVARNNGSFHTTHNGGHFFGSHSSPNFAAHSGSDAAHFHGASAPGVLGTTPRAAANTRGGSVSGTHSTSVGMNSTARMSGNRNFSGGTTGTRMSSPTVGSTRFAPSAVSRGPNSSGTRTPGVATRTWNGSTGVGSRTWNSSAFANRTWNTTALNSRAWAPAHQSWAPQSSGARGFAVPQSHSFAGMGGSHGAGMGGSFHGSAGGGGSFHGGGGMGGGGFHGGGGHGGGGGGGGHGGGHR